MIVNKSWEFSVLLIFFCFEDLFSLYVCAMYLLVTGGQKRLLGPPGTRVVASSSVWLLGPEL